MKRLLFLFLTCLCIFYSCRTTDKKVDENEQSGSDSSITAPANYYKQFEGTIGTQPVVLHLVKTGNSYNINYSYNSIGKPIDLMFEKDSLLKNDSLLFREFADYTSDYANRAEDKYLRLSITDKAINGFWIDGNKKQILPVVLKQTTNAAAFTPVVHADSLLFTGFKKDTPSVYSNIVLLQPTQKEVDWYSNAVKKDILGEQNPDVAVDLQTTVTNFSKDFLTRFKNEMDTLKASNQKEENLPVSMMHYDQQMTSNLIYNNNGFAVLSNTDFVYTGGAHGMYGQTFLCFDLNAKKIMSPADVISIDSTQLRPLLEKQLRIQYKIPDGKPLTEVLFDKQLSLTDNFYFTAKGLGYVYQPYEVAAYAVGLVDIYIPYTELTTYLNPDFRKRMGI